MSSLYRGRGYIDGHGCRRTAGGGSREPSKGEKFASGDLKAVMRCSSPGSYFVDFVSPDRASEMLQNDWCSAVYGASGLREALRDRDVMNKGEIQAVLDQM